MTPTHCSGMASRSSIGSSSMTPWVAFFLHWLRVTTPARWGVHHRPLVVDWVHQPRPPPAATAAECRRFATLTWTPSSETVARCHPPAQQLQPTTYVTSHRHLDLHKVSFGVRTTAPLLKQQEEVKCLTYFGVPLRLSPRGIYHPTFNNHGALPSSPLSILPLPVVLPSPLIPSFVGETTPFNRLGRLGERCKLPSGVWGEVHPTSTLVYS